ncbi:TPA: hypothetical protein DEW49_01335, partial [bacterium]|nr:hypothetical protein [bacterium]
RAEAIRKLTDTYNEMKNYEAARRTYALLVGYEELGLKPPEEKKKEEEEKKSKGVKEQNPIIRDYLNTADRLYVNNKYKEAMFFYQRIIQESPDSPYCAYAQRNIGICYAGLKDYEKSVEELEKVVKKYPESSWAPNALERMGIYYWQGLEDLDKAITAFSELIDKYPEDTLAPQGYYSLGQIYTIRKDYKKAKATYHLLIQKYPDFTFISRVRENLRKIAKEERSKGK